MTTTVRRLIDKARQNHGSDTNVAALMGVTRQRIAEWKSGRLPIPMLRLAHLASLAGVSEEEAVADYATERFAHKLAASGIPSAATAPLVATHGHASQNRTKPVVRKRHGRT